MDGAPNLGTWHAPPSLHDSQSPSRGGAGARGGNGLGDEAVLACREDEVDAEQNGAACLDVRRFEPKLFGEGLEQPSVHAAMCMARSRASPWAPTATAFEHKLVGLACPSRKAGGATASEPDAEARDSRAPRSHFVSEVPKMRAKGGRRCVNGRIRGWGRPSGSSSQRARTGRRRKPSGEGGGNESSRGRAAESKGRSNIARQCETHATYVCARGAGRGAARGRRATRAQCVFGASEECSAVASFNARVEKVR